MGDIHLKQLRNLLEKCHWRFVAEKPGDGYRISGVWEIVRPDGSNPLSLHFNGLDDLRTLPMEQSYACFIKEHPEIDLYFGKISRSWKDNLSEFADKLKALN